MLAMPSASSLPLTKIILPDLVSHCKFDIRVNRHRKQITSETKRWLFKGDNLKGKKRDAFHGLKAGLLSAICYPDAGCPQLRLVNDFLTYLFHLDNLSDDMDNRGTRATADVVLNSLYHPYTSRSQARVGKMTREYVKKIRSSITPNKLVQLSQATPPHGISGNPTTVHRDVRLLLPGCDPTGVGPRHGCHPRSGIVHCPSA